MIMLMGHKMTKPDMILFLSDARGVYLPRDFAQSIRRDALTGVKADDMEILEAGPDHEWYWEAWDNVCRDAVITDQNGTKYSVYQNGDCWLVPEGMEWSDKEETYFWPSEDADEE